MNKKLYKISVRHVAPKDSHTSIECFLFAQNETSVYEWISEKLLYDKWEEISNDDDEDNVFYIYDDDYNTIGTETYKEKMIRIKGDINDEDYDYSDAYYGITQYGWEEVETDFTTLPMIVDSLKEVGVLTEI